MNRSRSWSSMFRLTFVLCGWLFYSVWPHMAASATGAAKESSGLRLLEELQTVITDLAEEAKPSVVSIFPIQPMGRPRDGASDRMPSSTGSGSGVIVDPQGHILTNNHVVGDAAEVEVRFSDKTRLFAQVIGKDPDTDLAVLKVTTDRPLPAARSVQLSAPCACRLARPRHWSWRRDRAWLPTGTVGWVCRPARRRPS